MLLVCLLLHFAILVALMFVNIWLFDVALFKNMTDFKQIDPCRTTLAMGYRQALVDTSVSRGGN